MLLTLDDAVSVLGKVTHTHTYTHTVRKSPFNMHTIRFSFSSVPWLFLFRSFDTYDMK